MNTKYTPGPWRMYDRYHGCVLTGPLEKDVR
jgi:hypothetical protein